MSDAFRLPSRLRGTPSTAAPVADGMARRQRRLNPDKDGFVCTPFGRRRKRFTRTRVTVAAGVAAGVACLAWLLV